MLWGTWIFFKSQISICFHLLCVSDVIIVQNECNHIKNIFLSCFSALKDVSERIGGSATFKYKLPHEGAPIEWTHNGKRIYPEKEPHKYEIVSDGLNRTLVIKNLKIEEQGSIGVKIADKVSSAKLQVQGL